MTTMVERVARALCCGWHSGSCVCEEMGDSKACQAVHEFEKARAAIETMREPTDEILFAIFPHLSTHDRIKEDGIPIWRDAIDAALKEGD